MSPLLMRPIHNAIAIVATFFAAGALLPWGARLRLLCAAAAFGLILFLFVFRLRAHAASRQRRSTRAAHDRIEHIRRARLERLGPRR